MWEAAITGLCCTCPPRALTHQKPHHDMWYNDAYQPGLPVATSSSLPGPGAVDGGGFAPGGAGGEPPG